MTVWCYKANPKTNPLRLETKQEELCPYIFKCVNCKDNYMANDSRCPF